MRGCVPLISSVAALSYERNRTRQEARHFHEAKNSIIRACLGACAIVLGYIGHWGCGSRTFNIAMLTSNNLHKKHSCSVIGFHVPGCGCVFLISSVAAISNERNPAHIRSLALSQSNSTINNCSSSRLRRTTSHAVSAPLVVMESTAAQIILPVCLWMRVLDVTNITSLSRHFPSQPLQPTKKKRPKPVWRRWTAWSWELLKPKTTALSALWRK